MGDEERESTQLRFQNGELVPADGHRHRPAGGRATTVRPGDGNGYTVTAKPGALEANSTLIEAVESHGQPLEFGSRRQAERYADQLSAGDGGLRLQSGAPNDPASVDAYLLAAHDPAITEPAAIEGETWTFDVGANLYGALGEAILLAAPKPHALYYYVTRDLERTDGTLHNGVFLDVQRETSIISTESADSGHTWLPDCVILARDGYEGPPLETYYCEIKTGEASFEPGQRETMESLATTERVLTIRVLPDRLPDRYGLRIREVEPSE
jgi:hypothetical protein